MTFRYESRILLPHTFAAGILFYSRMFELAFAAFSAFLDHIGIGVHYIIHESPFLVPFVHADVDFLQPLRLGDEAIFELQVERLGTTSFTMNYTVTSGGRPAARLRTVHVTVAKSDGRPMPLPEALRRGLQPYVSES